MYYKVHIQISPVVPTVSFTAKPQTFQISSGFPLMSFFSFLGFSPQSHMSFSYHAPLISSHLGQSRNLSLSFVDLDTFEVYWPVILKNVPQFGFILYFLMITLCIFDKNTRGDVPFSLHQYQGVHHLSLSYGW